MIAYSSSPDNGAPSTSTAGTSQQPIMFGGMFSLSNSWTQLEVSCMLTVLAAYFHIDTSLSQLHSGVQTYVEFIIIITFLPSFYLSKNIYSSVLLGGRLPEKHENSCMLATYCNRNIRTWCHYKWFKHGSSFTVKEASILSMALIMPFINSCCILDVSNFLLLAYNIGI